jgi:hypothetical protein
MTALAIIALVAIAAAADWLSIAWHRARESGRVARTVALSVALETLNAVPFAAAIAVDDWRLLAAGVAGSAIGTALGMRHAPADR